MRRQVFQKGCRFPSHHGRSFDSGVEARTLETLDSQKVPTPVVVTFFTVVAYNSHNTRHFRWDRLECNTHGHGGPGRGHLFVRLGRLFAYRTACVKGGEFAEAVPMNGVAAGHFVTGAAGRKEIFLTNRTVGHVFASLAIVIVKQQCVDAHATVVAVTKVAAATDAAETTVLAVVGVLLGGHP